MKQSEAPATTRQIMLTPKIAKELLERNINNRKVSESTVDNYARDMLAGAWTEAESMIMVGKDGTLYNGQHRCLAVVKSGVTIPATIRTGVSDEARLNMDGGKKRNVGENYDMAKGEMNGKQLFELARAILVIVASRNQSSPFEKNKVLERHRTGIDWAVGAFPGIRTGVGAASIRGAMAFVYDAIWHSQKSQLPKVEEFAEQLRTGVGILSETEPVMLLRRSLEVKKKISPRDLSVKTMRAVMAHLRDEKISILYPTDDAAAYFGAMLGYELKGSSADKTLVKTVHVPRERPDLAARTKARQAARAAATGSDK